MGAVLLAGLTLSGALRVQQEKPDRVYGTEIRSLLKRYCFECHAGEDSEADTALS